MRRVSETCGASGRLRALDLREEEGALEALPRLRAALGPDELLEVVLPRGQLDVLPGALASEGHGADTLLLLSSGPLPPLLRLIGLPPPEPMEQILGLLVELPPGGRLLAELPHVPTPLLGILARQGARWELIERPDGSALLCVLR